MAPMKLMKLMKESLTSLWALYKKIGDEPWDLVKAPEFVVGTFFAAVISYFSNTGGRWIPVLDGANLLFHEAGHPFFGLLSNRLEIYGGTLGQLFFPILIAGYFWKERKTVSFFVCLVWLVQNFWNIARFMSDARARLLPLVGNGDRIHDWAEIFGRWQVLSIDTRIAGFLSLLAGTGLVFLWWWFAKKWFADRSLE